jgi:hypothetical protein
MSAPDPKLLPEIPKAYFGPRFQPVLWTDKFERLHPYEPSQQEYLDQLVVRPEITTKIVQRLHAERLAIVLGRGASGKTVLGNLLTLDENLGATQSFYLNVGRYQDSTVLNFTPVAPEIFAEAEPNALFIVDNIHLDENLAHEIWRQWSTIASKPYLLLLGRELRKREGSRFTSGSARPFFLYAGKTEAQGVFDRLARRHLRRRGDQTIPPSITDEAISRWIETFGGPLESANTTVDLMILSAAIHQKMDRLLAGKWTLTTADAQDEVRSKYLDVSKEERRNLLRLSALPDDFRLPAEALFDRFNGFRKSLERGIVFESNLGRHYYYFAHPALGRLIADAYGDTKLLSQELDVLAAEHPATIMFVGQRLIREQRFLEATQIFEKLAFSKDWIDRYDDHLGAFLHAVEAFTQLNIMSDEKLAENLSAHPKAVRKLITRSALATILDFISFLEDNKYFIALNPIINELPDYINLKGKIHDAPLDKIAGLLKYTDRFPKVKPLLKLREMIVHELSADPRILGEMALRAPFNQFMGFILYLDDVNLYSLRDLMLSNIDRERWNVRRLNERDVPGSFTPIARILRSVGRSDLATSPAQALILAADIRQWRSAGIGDLSNALSFATSLPKTAQHDFLRTIVTTKWLDKQYNIAEERTLIGSLFSIFARVEETDLSLFLLPSLESRLHNELSRLKDDDVDGWADTVSLLGVFAIIGGSLPDRDVKVPSDELVGKMIALRQPEPGQKTISILQLQMWFGLWEIAKSQNMRTQLPIKIADRILNLARDNKPISIQVADLNRKLITWLEHCENNGWVLKNE